MAYEVEFTDLFRTWWDSLSPKEQDSVDFGVRLLERYGPALARPHVDTLRGSLHKNMKELRVQHAGRPLRVLFAFDPRRAALLLLGGEKTGNKRWYEQNLPIADALLSEHLRNLKS